MLVHPLFDIEDKVWVYGNTIAPSLRELQEKLPEAEIVGFYPDGFNAPFNQLGKTIDDLRPSRSTYGRSTSQAALKIDRELQSKQAKPKAEPRFFSKQQRVELGKLNRKAVFNQRHEMIMVEVAKGTSRKALATYFDVHEDTIRDHVRKARQVGDVRADVKPVRGLRTMLNPAQPKSHSGLKYSTWTEEQDTTLRTLAAQGKSANYIACELGVFTRNAVIGRARRTGIKIGKNQSMVYLREL